ncbi:MAG: 30S ribosomal protein S13 [Patescibacteria group bacterium]|nr:30S ribosomal protein S13 [Patescibacteria group bacterium]
MARISGVVLPQNKRIDIALTYIFGIGKTRAEKIIKETGVDPSIRTKDLSADQEKILREAVEKTYRVEGELRREVLSNIKRMKEISCFRGTRHAKKLPARGQRSKTNSRTVRGNIRHTAGSGKRKLEKT